MTNPTVGRCRALKSWSFDASVARNVKLFAGYNGGSVYKVEKEDLKNVKGRGDEEYE